MILIFGGARQGKLKQAEKEFDKMHSGVVPVIRSCAVPNEDQVSCAEYLQRVDFYADIINDFQNFTLACARVGVNPGDIMGEHPGGFDNKIIVCTDISQGIVPVEKDLRAWREINGRMLSILSGSADKVIRMFCGIPQILKENK